MERRCRGRGRAVPRDRRARGIRHRRQPVLRHQGVHRDGRAAVRRRRGHRPRCSGPRPLARDRRPARARFGRRGRHGDHPPATAGHHSPDAARAHLRTRVRRLRPHLRDPRQGARARRPGTPSRCRCCTNPASGGLTARPDWLGVLVARVRGERLEHVFREQIYEPCGMTSTSFDLTPEMAARAATVHRRQRYGEIVPAPRPRRPVDARHGRTGALVDRARRARPAARLAGRRHRTRRPGAAARDDRVGRGASTGRRVTPLEPAIPALTRRLYSFPELPTSWAHRFLRVDVDVPGRRHAGSLSWVGLGNVNYWIDRASGLAGMWAAQLIPLRMDMRVRFRRVRKVGIRVTTGLIARSIPAPRATGRVH